MKKAPALVAVIAVAVAVVAAMLFIPRGADEGGSGGFVPFEDTDGQTEGGSPDKSAEPANAPPAEPPDDSEETAANQAAPAEPGDDTLNRTGPDGARRTVKNRRPRTEEPEGKQSDPTRGTMNKEDVRKGIEAVRPLVKVCYEEMLQEFPKASGKVVVGFRIGAEDGEGRVEMSELKDDGTTLFDEKLHDCLQARISEAKFSAPSGGGVVDVRYPFVFATDSDESDDE